MSNKAAVCFRVVAIAEVISWAGLLIGMFFKYIVDLGEGGVPTLGMIHGVVFIGYVVTTLAVFRPLNWRPMTLVLALAASVPPLCTWPFEKWAVRTGKLDGPEAAEHGEADRPGRAQAGQGRSR